MKSFGRYLIGKKTDSESKDYKVKMFWSTGLPWQDLVTMKIIRDRIV